MQNLYILRLWFNEYGKLIPLPKSSYSRLLLHGYKEFISIALIPINCTCVVSTQSSLQRCGQFQLHNLNSNLIDNSNLTVLTPTSLTIPNSDSCLLMGSLMSRAINKSRIRCGLLWSGLHFSLTFKRLAMSNDYIDALKKYTNSLLWHPLNVLKSSNYFHSFSNDLEILTIFLKDFILILKLEENFIPKCWECICRRIYQLSQLS